MQKPFAFFALTLGKDFSAFCSCKLQEIGITQGLLYFILYIGKYSGCAAGDLTRDLHMDWGYTQRSVNKLVQEGFILKKQNEHDKRAYNLFLTPKGENAFSISHQVFFDWDETVLKELSSEEKNQLFTILDKVNYYKGDYFRVQSNQQPD